MPTYKNTKGQLTQIKGKPYKFEQKIQSLIEENL